jgi:hypothetical protein
VAEASLRIVEKRNHGSMPANTMTGYGTVPSLGSPATRPNTIVKITIVRNGRRTAQAKPMTVCLYRTATLRAVWSATPT